MEFLRLLETLRTPILDEVMLAITKLGEESALLVAAILVFWCVDKRRGYYILLSGLLGTLVNQFMKLWFRVPRPWELDGSFTIVERAREAAAGYSFPSGHTQTAFGTFGALACTAKHRWTAAISMALAVLVGFSRLYLGVHTPADVLMGAGVAVLLLLVLYPLVMKGEGKATGWLFGAGVLLSLGLLAFARLYEFPADVDQENLQSGVKNAYTMLGVFSGLTLVWIVDSRWLKFSTEAPWWGQLIKAVVGLALVLAVREGLRGPLEALFGDEMLARAVRYFAIVVTAGILWPLSFRLFRKK